MCRWSCTPVGLKNFISNQKLPNKPRKTTFFIIDLFVAILEAIEEDYHRGVKVARPKTKGRREVLNLASSINYGDSSASSRLRKGKTHMVYGWGLL
jgi:hypothetical protein